MLSAFCQEIIACKLHIPDTLWRIWFGRYLMLLWLGYDITQNGIGMNRWRWIASLIGFFSLTYFAYVNSELEPLFFSTGWYLHRWICYPYAAYFLVWLLYIIFNRIPTRYQGYFTQIGKSSYEIFLVQMIFASINYSSLFNIENDMASMLINIIVVWGGPLLLGMGWSTIKRFKKYTI